MYKGGLCDVSAIFTQVYDAMMEKFERLSAMNDHNAYNQQIYDMYLDLGRACADQTQANR